MRLFRFRDDRFDAIEKSLGHRFRDPALLETALTHRSHSHEQGEGLRNYERLEFLGDALLGFLVAETLYHEDPEANEGVLSRRRQSVVRTATLAGAAERIGLGQAVLLGRGEEQTGGRRKSSLLADAFEAVLGAIYLDGGMRAVRRFVARHLQESMTRSQASVETMGDYKTQLQERVQARLQQPPRYRIVSTSGPAHQRSFEVEVLIGEQAMGRGEGTTRKRAEQMAAREALDRFERGGGDPAS